MIFQRDAAQEILAVNTNKHTMNFNLHSDKATALFFAKTDLSPMESLNNSRPSIAESNISEPLTEGVK